MYGVEVGFFSVGLAMGLLVVPSCGLGVGILVSWGLRHRLLWFGG